MNLFKKIGQYFFDRQEQEDSKDVINHIEILCGLFNHSITHGNLSKSKEMIDNIITLSERIITKFPELENDIYKILYDHFLITRSHCVDGTFTIELLDNKIEYIKEKL